jgi:hypothetical protein
MCHFGQAGQASRQKYFRESFPSFLLRALTTFSIPYSHTTACTRTHTRIPSHQRNASWREATSLPLSHLTGSHPPSLQTTCLQTWEHESWSIILSSFLFYMFPSSLYYLVAYTYYRQVTDPGHKAFLRERRRARWQTQQMQMQERDTGGQGQGQAGGAAGRLGGIAGWWRGDSPVYQRVPQNVGANNNNNNNNNGNDRNRNRNDRSSRNLTRGKSSAHRFSTNPSNSQSTTSTSQSNGHAHASTSQASRPNTKRASSSSTNTNQIKSSRKPDHANQPPATAYGLSPGPPSFSTKRHVQAGGGGGSDAFGGIGTGASGDGLL